MNSSQREAPRTLDILMDDRSVPITIRRSARARRYTLRLVPTGELILTLPVRGSLDRAIAFAHAQEGWIRTRLSRVPERVLFEEGALIPLRGLDHEIRRSGSRRGSVGTVSSRPGKAPLLLVGGEEPHLARRLADWLKAEAKRDLEAAVARHAAKLDVTVKRLSVRDQTSRWGSCSSNGTLSFSWRLILAPSYVLDYLAAHEVAHLIEMNHGIRFWRIVKSVAPQTGEAEAWLKRHGSGLHRYGVRQAA